MVKTQEMKEEIREDKDIKKKVDELVVNNLKCCSDSVPVIYPSIPYISSR